MMILYYKQKLASLCYVIDVLNVRTLGPTLKFVAVRTLGEQFIKQLNMSLSIGLLSGWPPQDMETSSLG